MLEVYMNNVIVNYNKGINHTTHLYAIFKGVRRYKIWLNNEKCIFGVKIRKFWGYELT